jgi:hypothetical protein
VVRLTNVLAFPTGGVVLGERLGCAFVLVFLHPLFRADVGVYSLNRFICLEFCPEIYESL